MGELLVYQRVTIHVQQIYFPLPLRKASITLCVYFSTFSCLGQRVLSGDRMRKKSARWLLGDMTKVLEKLVMGFWSVEVER